ncbi:Endonuclease IV [Ferrithrix thermotolerans DSM 19514]|uniref:Probable endonuclease 4 n=1 Tax=Ferrithrix thermotolerans DSM 19514 TaxID=1121881 RepID=A0A1M4VJL2_9ACTN|nr:deoxyribonuclease IV [Ferrithrix thermotolerans]SHE69080.1 Endonuclease IV [Ferrithrix thermotolerans DSM 19514]
MLIGAHVSASGGLYNAVSNGEEIGAQCIQIFVGSPRTWKTPTLGEKVLSRYREALANSEVVQDAVVHASYLINLGSSDPDLFERSKDLLISTVDVACAIEAYGVVLHLGSHKGHGLDAVEAQLADVFEEVGERLPRSSRTKLLLENTAGAGGTIGGSLEEVERILQLGAKRARVGLCIDTQHIFAYGYDLRNPEDRGRTIDKLSRFLDAVDCVHLNDSKSKCGGLHDRHENLGEGEIGEDALAAFLGASIFANSLVFLEVPGDGSGPRSSDVEAAKRLLTASG